MHANNPIEAPEALAFDRTAAPECMTIAVIPTVLMVDEDGDGLPDVYLIDFNGDGVTDCRQTRADRRTIVTVPCPTPWFIPPTATRTTGGRDEAVLRVCFHREHIAPGTWSINAMPSVLTAADRMTSIGLLYPEEREMRDELAAGRELWIEAGGFARESFSGKGAAK